MKKISWFDKNFIRSKSHLHPVGRRKRFFLLASQFRKHPAVSEISGTVIHFKDGSRLKIDPHGLILHNGGLAFKALQEKNLDGGKCLAVSCPGSDKLSTEVQSLSPLKGQKVEDTDNSNPRPVMAGHPREEALSPGVLEQPEVPQLQAVAPNPTAPRIL
jgi:hypothetical protein